jgi:hypothetical protein
VEISAGKILQGRQLSAAWWLANTNVAISKKSIEVYEILIINLGDISKILFERFQGGHLPMASDVAFGLERSLWENRQLNQRV